jgi:uncharacterized membrane protein
MEEQRRRKMLIQLGAAMIVAFVLIRFTNLYGDRSLWSVQQSPIYTLMSFLNCTKYPPSLLYVLMTLGPAILTLGLVRQAPRVLKPLVYFGRVPMFYYLLHIPLIHLMTITLDYFQTGNVGWLFTNEQFIQSPPDGRGVGLLGVYIGWLIAVAILYPLCKWFAGVKQRRTDPWLSYL